LESEARVKPELVDNAGGNTMAEALRAYLDDLHERLKAPVELRVASGYFNSGGFGLVASKLARLPKVRLLLGAEPIPPPAQPMRMPGEPRGQRLERAEVQKALGLHSEGLARDRDLLPFEPAQEATLRNLVEFLRSGRAEVRRYEKAFLHGKCWLFGTEDGTLVGSSNFTFAGLTTNLELNIGHYDPRVVRQASEWFDRLWAEAVPYDLAALYEARFEPHPPYIVYLRMLWELFGADLAADVAGSDLRLTAFQRDGVSRAQRILAEHGGVLVADEVGLGKTFVAGELIRIALKENRQRVLVIAPAALRDGPWDSFTARHFLRDAEVISFEQLQRDKRLGAGGDEQTLRRDPNAYALVIVDEAQAVRNPSALRSRALQALLRGAPKKKLVLMTATPVNNSVWDLHTLLSNFLGDADLADRGVTSLVKHFRIVASTNPEDLAPNTLFGVLDATTVRRTRHFIKRYYPNDKIRAADGSEVHIRFPKPAVLPVTYDLDAAMPGLFDWIRDALAPASGVPALTLARYAPDDYKKRSVQSGSTAALVGLVRTGILKRFESSAFAFEMTLRTLMRGFDTFLKGLSEGKVLRGRGLSELEDLSDTDGWRELIEDGEWEPADDYNVPKLRAAVESDRDLFAGILAEVERLPSLDNPKLHALEQQLARIAKEAGDDRDSRKVLIFTFFEDTADWIYRYLSEVVALKRDLAVYRGRVAAVAGDRTWGGVSRDEAVFGFAPKSTEAPSGRDDDKFDILVTTDVLAEGMNLQQCRHIVNFDLPWNPMRLVQRHGRVDRIGSPHDRIFLRCFFPDARLEALLALEATLRAKIAQAAATIGLGAEVIPGSKIMEKAFAETREELERLQRGDATLFERSGEKPGVHSGEEYRYELKKALDQPHLKEAVLGLPGAAGTVRKGGDVRGYVFCARIGERAFLRFVPADEAQPVDAEVLGCLRLAYSEPSDTPITDQDAWRGAYAAWLRARRSIYDQWTWSTDPKNIEPSIPAVLRRAADHLRRNPPGDVPQERVKDAIEALEAPLSGRKQRSIRDVFEGPAASGMAPVEISRVLLDEVAALGLEPYRAPKPLPEINEDEVRLACWMALVP
jgi:hypothetical protein